MSLEQYKGNQRVDPADLLNFLQNFILPALGGGGGGGNASASNQLTEIARLTSILNVLSTYYSRFDELAKSSLQNDEISQLQNINSSLTDIQSDVANSLLKLVNIEYNTAQSYLTQNLEVTQASILNTQNDIKALLTNLVNGQAVANATLNSLLLGFQNGTFSITSL